MSVRLKVNPKTVQRSFKYLEELEVFNVATGDGRYITDNQAVIDRLREYMMEEEIKSFIKSILGKKYSQEELISIYGESLRDEVYVELDDTMPNAKFEKNISELLKGKIIYSNSYSISNLEPFKLLIVLILANITGAVLILKLYFREKKQK